MIGCLGCLALMLAQQPPVFSTRVELVYVDVFVTKKSAPVTGLESTDFRLEDNGVRQEVELLDRAVVPTTAILVLDTSASVEGGHLVHLKEAARTLLSNMAPRDEAALVTFNEKVQLRQDSTRDVRLVAAALDRVRPRGGTALIDAVYMALKRRWGTGRPIIVLFTDGQDSASWLENEDVSRRRASPQLCCTSSAPNRSARHPSGQGHERAFRNCAPVCLSSGTQGVSRRCVP